VKVVVVAVLLGFCAGCHFSVGALNDLGGGGEVDMADGPDLASGDPGDLGTANDLTMSAPPDLVPDPCAGAPALGSGNIAAQCVIGTPPTVDGNLADWPLTSFLPMTKTTSAQANGTWDVPMIPNDTNASARYFVRWDLSYLYVAISITDDVRNSPNTTDSQISNNDAIEIFVDGGHERSNSYDSNDWQLAFDTNLKMVAGNGSAVVTFPAGTKQGWGGTSPSWTLEAAIPWSIMGGSAAAPGRLVGFDLKLDDNDAGTARDRDLVLFYNPGNGNGSCNAPFCRADAFGTVQLQGR
jgi:hypothetical protein